jgi:hypothetical protein
MTKENQLAGTPSTTAPLSATAIAENLLREIVWVSPTMGYCECPGHEQHTNQNGRRDCVLYLDQVPTLHCVHDSCREIVAETNRKLRAAVLNGTNEGNGTVRKLTKEGKARRDELQRCQRLIERTAKALPRLLVDHEWTYQQICADSPVKLSGKEAEHWTLLLAKFNPEDIVWLGDKYDSGKPEHASCFKSAAQWLQQTTVAPAPLICPSVFKPGSVARSNNNVIARPFLVVESDVLTKDQVGAVFKWLKDDCGLPLVAIVDTAGKSLHGWFQYPADDAMVKNLKLVLPALGCDPKLFTPSQPVRLPGALRDGKYQKLVYLAGNVEVAHE